MYCLCRAILREGYKDGSDLEFQLVYLFCLVREVLLPVFWLSLDQLIKI